MSILIPTLVSLGFGIFGMMQHHRGDFYWFQCGWMWVGIISIIGAVTGLGVFCVTKLIGIS